MAVNNMEIRLPQKKYFRQRAHSNPMADHSFIYPSHPSLLDWSAFYPENMLKKNPDNENNDDSQNEVRFADVGCGYGGLLVDLANVFPSTLMLGMEIRVKVSEYVKNRILALRQQNEGQYGNIAIVRTNAMKYMPNFFNKGQLTKVFFLFPDPHFKKKKNKWRIISPTLLAEYAYVMAVGGIVYTVTDVHELHLWMKQHFTDHPLFRPMEPNEYKDDAAVDKILHSTEEGKKVARNSGDKYLAIFERINDPYIPKETK